jgi:hypothetical protein
MLSRSVNWTCDAASPSRWMVGVSSPRVKTRGSNHDLEQGSERPRLRLDASGNERLASVGKHQRVARLDVSVLDAQRRRGRRRLCRGRGSETIPRCRTLGAPIAPRLSRTARALLRSRRGNDVLRRSLADAAPGRSFGISLADLAGRSRSRPRSDVMGRTTLLKRRRRAALPGVRGRRAR